MIMFRSLNIFAKNFTDFVSYDKNELDKDFIKFEDVWRANMGVQNKKDAQHSYLYQVQENFS